MVTIVTTTLMSLEKTPILIMSGWKLIIDKREQAVPSLVTFKLPTEERLLDVGDFMIVDAENNPYLVIERKTWADLASAIETDRYKEQKLRLRNFSCKFKVYLIEGELDKWRQHGRINKLALKSASLGTAIRDGFSMVFTKSYDDTIEYINIMSDKLNDWIRDAPGRDVPADASSWVSATNVKVKKSANLTSQACYIHQLGQIPKISEVGANAIAKVYKSMPELISAYLSIDEKDRPRMLENIQMDKRRLGPASSRVVYETLWCVEK